MTAALTPTAIVGRFERELTRRLLAKPMFGLVASEVVRPTPPGLIARLAAAASDVIGLEPSDRLVQGAVSLELLDRAICCHVLIDSPRGARATSTAPSRCDPDAGGFAILIGDYLFHESSALAAELGTPAVALAARTTVRRTVAEVREAADAFDVQRTLGRYVEVLEDGFASVAGAAADLPVVLSGVDSTLRDALVEIGSLYGGAYQVSRDIAALQGGRDQWLRYRLAGGIYPMPVIAALQDEPMSGPLHAALSQDGERPDLGAIGALVSCGGGTAVALSYARTRAIQALRAAESLPRSALLVAAIRELVDELDVSATRLGNPAPEVRSVSRAGARLAGG